MDRRRRVTGWLACMTVAICSVGVPLPAQAVKKSGEPFPCQNCPCGCPDAETCWRDCCCHTNREKLAWAKQNGVKPPAFVIAAARRESCCTETGNNCCGKSPASTAKSCCSTTRGCGEQKLSHCSLAAEKPASGNCSKCQGYEPEAGEPSPENGSRSGIVLLTAKLRCSGISLSVSWLPPSIIPRPHAMALELHLHSAIAEAAPPRYESPYLAIPAPPPDSLVA